MRFVRKFFAHPRTQTTRKIVRRTLSVAAVILAVAFVFTLTYDIGRINRLREYAADAGTKFLSRDGTPRKMSIGELSIRLWDGAYVIRNLRIDGLTPQSRPWLTAKEIAIKLPWRSIDFKMPWEMLVKNEIVIESIEMTDWTMYVEQTPDGRHSFPNFKRESKGPGKWTTTLKYVRASRGEFTFNDLGTPWGVIARNIDVTVAKPADQYRRLGPLLRTAWSPSRTTCRSAPTWTPRSRSTAAASSSTRLIWRPTAPNRC